MPGGNPPLVGTNAYILFARAAQALLRPVKAEADITLTLLDAPTQCRTQRGIFRPPHPARCEHLHAPPSHQYGPSSWLVGQDLRGLEQKTHYDDAIRMPARRAQQPPRDRQVASQKF